MTTSKESLQEPLTPPDLDLRDYPSMLLDVVKLRDSDVISHDNAEVVRHALLSWCISWHQVPAASLPDDDKTLAKLFGYGKTPNAIRDWKKARAAEALYGWIKCSDGRLYHPVVAEKALEATQKKRKQKAQTEAARAALRAKQTGSTTETVYDPETGEITEVRTAETTGAVASPVTGAVTTSKEGRKEGTKEVKTLSREERTSGGSSLDAGDELQPGRPRVIGGGKP